MTGLDFDRFFGALPQPHAVFDRDLRFVAVNRALEQAIHRPAAAMLGHPLDSFLQAENEGVARMRAALQRVLSTGEPSSIAFLRYDIVQGEAPETPPLRRYWSITYTPILDEEGATEFILATITDVTELARMKDHDGEATAAEVAVIENARAVERAFTRSREQADELRRLFRQSPGLIAVLEGPEFRFGFVNDSLARFAGKRRLVGRTVLEALPELHAQGFSDILETVYSTGRAVSGEGARMRVQPPTGSDRPEEVFFDYTCNPLMDEAGHISGIFFQGADMTETVRATHRHRILVDELNHRVKNTLSTVQAMARQSFRNLRDPEEARYAFEARIMALSQAHNVLSARRWESAGLAVLLAKELSGFPPERIALKGPPVLLESKPAIALAMVFHELASNAARYGALSSQDGTLAVEWSTEPAGTARSLRFCWTERGAPVTDRELTPGFGIKVLKRIVEGELAGTLTIDLRESGLVCRLEILLSGIGDIESSVA